MFRASIQPWQIKIIPSSIGQLRGKHYRKPDADHFPDAELAEKLFFEIFVLEYGRKKIMDQTTGWGGKGMENYGWKVCRN